MNPEQATDSSGLATDQHLTKYMVGDRESTICTNIVLFWDFIIGAWYLNPEEVDIPPGKYDGAEWIIKRYWSIRILC